MDPKYKQLIECAEKCKLKYKLPPKSELTDDLLDKVLCFGIAAVRPGMRLSYTDELFKIIISRHDPKNLSNRELIPELTKLIVEYYDIKLVYDTDHSRKEYAEELIRMKDNVLKNITLILNHVYTDDEDLLEKIDYIMDYSPDFVIDRELIPKKYAHKLRPTIYSTVVYMPYIRDVSQEVIDYVKTTNMDGGYILAGGRTRRDYSKIVEACNRVKVNLLICDTNLEKHNITETKYVKTMIVNPRTFNYLIQNSLFVACPAIDNVPTPIGITVICKSNTIGKICVSTVNTGIEPFIEDGKTGFIVNNTVEAFEEVIIKLLNSQFRSNLEQNLDKVKYTEQGAKERTRKFIYDIMN